MTHSEAVAPALSVLAAPHFKAANLEFRDALEEYRKSRYSDCLTKCNSAFESVMKALCKRNQWPFDENRATAWILLDSIISHSTLDKFFRDPLALIATMRNKLSSSHGGGTAVRDVERYVAQYAHHDHGRCDSVTGACGGAVGRICHANAHTRRVAGAERGSLVSVIAGRRANMSPSPRARPIDRSDRRREIITGSATPWFQAH